MLSQMWTFLDTRRHTTLPRLFPCGERNDDSSNSQYCYVSETQVGMLVINAPSTGAGANHGQGQPLRRFLAGAALEDVPLTAGNCNN